MIEQGGSNGTGRAPETYMNAWWNLWFAEQISRPEVPIKLHRPLATLVIQTYGWTHSQCKIRVETAKCLPRPTKFSLGILASWVPFYCRYFWIPTDCGTGRLFLAIQKFHQPSPRHVQFRDDFRDMFQFVFRFRSPLLSDFRTFLSKAVLSSEAHKADVMHPGSRLSTLLH